MLLRHINIITLHNAENDKHENEAAAFNWEGGVAY